MSRRTVRIPCDDLSLEGELLTADGSGPAPAIVVCHPHPQYGGDMHNNVVEALVEGALGHGLAALRFNFRGAGGSEGSYGGGEAEQHDVRAALAFARSLDEVDGTRVGLAGYSFGAAVCASVAGAEIPALALVALPTAAMAAPHSPLAAYERPLLLMSGDLDQVSDADALAELAGELPAAVDLAIVEGADHFWLGREHEVAATAGEFFARTLTLVR